ncbi:MAG: PleD family two-component system response regulator [Thermomicrobiales bacterium]
MLGYIIIGSFAGLAASAATLVLGGSFGFALALYSMVGSAAVILVPILHVAINAVAARRSHIQTSSVSGKTSGHVACGLVSEHPRPLAETHHRPMRILAVDDDPFILGLIPGIAAKARYSDVTCAASAKLALATLASTETPFDCLLFDINMPEMDGIELCRHVRRIAAYRRTPIIMLTGKRDMKSMEQAFLAGATDYATKPFDVDELGARLAATYQTHGDQNDEIRSDNADVVDTSHEKQYIDGPESREVLLDGASKLVSSKALENYVTQASGKELSDTQVFAVKVDWKDLAHTRTSYLPFVSVLQDVAAAIDDILRSDQCMMADAGEGTVLVVTGGKMLPTSIQLEAEINRSLETYRAATVYGEGLAISVSVGRPITPEGTKAHRAGITFGRAIGSAKNRAFEKLGVERNPSLRLVG